MIDKRPLDERVTELQQVVTRLFTEFDIFKSRERTVLESPVFESEIPHYGPWMDTANCMVKVIAIRTGPSGEGIYATLRVLEDFDGYTGSKVSLKKGEIFDLRNSFWLPEFKRAQNYNLSVGIRFGKDGQVFGIEVGK